MDINLSKYYKEKYLIKQRNFQEKQNKINGRDKIDIDIYLLLKIT